MRKKKMKNHNIERIGYWSFVKLNTIAGAGFGIIISIIILIDVLFRGEASSAVVRLGENTYTGITAGLLGIIVGPVTCAIVFALLSMIFLYPGILIWIMIFKKLKLKLKLTDE